MGSRQLWLWHTVLSEYRCSSRLAEVTRVIYLVLVFVMKKQHVFCEAGTKILVLVLWSVYFKTCGGNTVLKPGLYCLKAVSLSDHKFSSFEWMSFHKNEPCEKSAELTFRFGEINFLWSRWLLTLNLTHQNLGFKEARLHWGIFTYCSGPLFKT